MPADIAISSTPYALAERAAWPGLAAWHRLAAIRRRLGDTVALSLGGRGIALAVFCAAISAMGAMANGHFDLPAVRLQVALACGALAATAALATCWADSPDRLGKGAALAVLAGHLSAAGALL
ncbi:MAG: hypothetical protein AVDCRST_MAG51-773 [uncultured Ramlibacter sp.]|uniref:Uncharacterized protein n=1 Tax=uncultured Ramlibacter sp. TaxID=260755 RepID=A0A6J4NXW5_9BURK|nr:MAG: hypothetical protein AVDCRST_MAG51-773 [uncultured Ramlibacter sp.]